MCENGSSFIIIDAVWEEILQGGGKKRKEERGKMERFGKWCVARGAVATLPALRATSPYAGEALRTGKMGKKLPPTRMAVGVSAFLGPIG